MSIEAVSFIPSATAQAIESKLPGSAGGTGTAPASGFGDWLSREIAQVNDKIQSTDKQVQDLALGKAGNLHDVMIALEDTKLSFQLMVQVRTRLLEAYQDILRMQV
ncbi:MAG TPA: flagellar hook-basal body complex protein FliE [Burkholderiales bacterium]|jgi:flagellar hook-basal body complex protein FliE|nr:flagellar hook-basal body complex protein FliE [Burkholderiales bacterium]